MAGSYSALVILETGQPFGGGFYLLPQYRAALDVRQGTILEGACQGIEGLYLNYILDK